MSPPETVIVVLNWNGLQDTLACLKSLSALQGEEHEILVVDNGSTDGSEEAIRAAYPDLAFVQTGANLGFAGGNNAGMRWALKRGARFVLLLNNDTVVEPDFLRHMIARAKGDSKVGIVGASIAYFDTPTRLWAFGGGRFDISSAWVRHVQTALSEDELKTRGNLHFYVTGCAMLLSRALLQEVGELESSYFHFCEDVDFCLRAERAGYRIVVAREARLLHKVSATTRVSSPLFLYYNLRSRLTLVRRFGPVGAPSFRAVCTLWLRLWRPAILSGMAWSGFKALLRAYRDYREGRVGPAPTELLTRRSHGSATALLLAVLVLSGLTLAPSGSTVVSAAESAAPKPLESESKVLSSLSAGISSDPARGLPGLLYDMAADSSVSRAVLAQADRRHCRLTHQLITLLNESDAQARKRIRGLYEVHDHGPRPSERPPAWSDLRRQGVEVLAKIALSPEVGRDARMRREIAHDELSQSPGFARAAVVAARVLLWDEWWADRGLQEEFWFHPQERPDPTDWLHALRSPPGEDVHPVGELLERLADDPLAFHALLAALDPGRDGLLVRECVNLLMLYQSDFEERGLPHRHWDADQGKMVGHRAEELRAIPLAILGRVCSFTPSGATEDEVIKSYAYFWRSARFQARYWRDPLAAPSLAPWLGGLDRPVDEGGQPLAQFLKQLYVAEGFRDLLLDQIGPGQSKLVAELIEWLAIDRKEAIARGFAPGYRRLPLRPLPGDKGAFVAIPWEPMQALIREVLRHITGQAGLGEEDATSVAKNAYWTDWWQLHSSQSRWYRSAPPKEKPPTFQMESGRRK